MKKAREIFMANNPIIRPGFNTMTEANVLNAMVQYANKTNIHILEEDRFKWSLSTFPEATAISSLRKLESEIKEIEADINKGIKEPEEFADALMCLFDSAQRHGITPQEIFDAFAVKLEKNKQRLRC